MTARLSQSFSSILTALGLMTEEWFRETALPLKKNKK